MLKQRYRFHGHSSLRYLFSKGRSFKSGFLLLKAVKNSRRLNSRVAVIVSKKTVKSAVKRNRIRRRIYEIIRFRINKFNDVYDLAIMVYSDKAIDIDNDKLIEMIDLGLKKIGLIDKI